MQRITRVVALLSLVLSPWPGYAQYAENVKQAIDVIVLFCVAGGEAFQLESRADIEGGLALRRFGVTGSGDIRLSKSDARGLVEGLTNEMDAVAGRQASEARACMKPYIDKILPLIMGAEGTGAERAAKWERMWQYSPHAMLPRGVVLEILGLRRVDDRLVQLDYAIINSSERLVSPPAHLHIAGLVDPGPRVVSHYVANQVYLVNPEDGARYDVSTLGGECLCSRVEFGLRRGDTARLWGQYEVPPGISKLTVRVPGVPPFRDVPVTE